MLCLFYKNEIKIAYKQKKKILFNNNQELRVYSQSVGLFSS